MSRGIGPIARVRKWAVAAALLALSGGGLPTHPGPAPAPPPAPVVSAIAPTKTLLIVAENHSADQALSGMPYLASLGRTYGVTTDYRAITHPSLPNYLAMAGGSTFGVTDDRSPASHPLRGQSVFDQAIASGRTAKTYAEAMPGNCGLSATSRYPVKHNAWAYFADATSRANCRRFDVPSGTPASGALRNDIATGSLPNVGALLPDICNSAHDCSLATADSWLRGWMTAITAGPDFKAGRLSVIITFDEDEGRSGNRVLTTVVAPGTRAVRSDQPYTHYSWTRYASELAGAAPLGAGRTAPSLRPAFGL